MNKMMKILKAGLIVLFLAFVLIPTDSYALIGGSNSDYSPGYNNPAGHTVAPDPSPSQPAQSSNSSTSSTVSVSGAQGFRTLDSNESAKDIFVILQKKIYGTLVDLRSIVYVIAGFGLVMFAVAAIFNKISYKHLGYIMIGLCLLSLMFPFLEYFSGYSLENEQQKQLTFDNFIKASNYASIRATLDSDITNPTGEGQPPMTEEEFERMKEENKAKYGGLEAIDNPLGGVTAPETGLAGQKEWQEAQQKHAENMSKAIQAGCDPTTMKSAWDSQTMTRKVCSEDASGNLQISTEVCQGKIKDGTCSKTAGQIFTDVMNTVSDVTQIGLNAGQAFNAGVGSIIDTVAGAQNIGDIWNNPNISFWDKLYASANMTTNTWGSNGAVTRDLSGIIGGLMGMTQHAGEIGTTVTTDYENNPTGQNPFTALMSLLGGYGTTATNAINNSAGYVNTAAGVGTAAHAEAINVQAIGALFSGQGTWKDRWEKVFGNK